MIPAWDQTGTPSHFHSSTTSGSASLISSRTRDSVSPRQSPSSLILASIKREGDFAFCGASFFFVFFFMSHALSAVATDTRTARNAGNTVHSLLRYPRLEVVCTLAHAKLDDPKIRETELAKRVLLRDRLDLLPILAYGENDAAVPWNFAAGDDERSGRVLLLEVSHVRAHRTVD